MIRGRYRRILFFFWRTVGALIWWELILANAGFRGWVRRTRSRRLHRIAAAFRQLAVEMGGVLIKVGQFLSARADVLPEEITAELSRLQDEVPQEDFEAIQRLAEAELGGPLAETFAQFEEKPLAAASLGQVHRARLIGKEETGGEVVVKIQRPNIEKIIATDLAALGVVGRWLMRYHPIRRRADLPALLAEFSRVLYEEIDYLAEGRNAETFAENMKGIPGVRVPHVVWALTTRRVLTLEDVYAIKITDYDEISAAGVDRKAVAKRVFDVYLGQIFEDGFFHADPHPGNLFVDPAGEQGEEWRLTFVDFGMVGRVPLNARAGLRELAIGLATKDSGRMVRSYQMLDVLLPGADLELLAQAEAIALDRFWGMSMQELTQIDMREMHDFAKEFRELVFEMPFQVPQDLIFLARTVAILAGLCTGLDPEFNFWESILPYAKQLLRDQGGIDWERWLREGGDFARSLIAVPPQLDKVLKKMDRGRLEVGVPDISRQIVRLEAAVYRLIYTLLFLGLLAIAGQFYFEGEDMIAWTLMGLSAIPLLAWLFAKRRA